MKTVILRFDPKVILERVKKGQFSKFKILKIKHTFQIQFPLRNPMV